MSDNLNKFEEGAQEEKKIDTGKKLRIGIIGTGWIAHSHMASYSRMPDVEIVAMADLIDGKAEAFAKEFSLEGVKFYPDHKSMLDAEKLDGVSVCTYNKTHAECCIYALQKGVSVLLEKPMCVTTEEAIAIVKAEKASGKFVSVGFQPRFSPNMQMIKKIIDSGELGKVYYIQTGGGRRTGIPFPYGTSFIEKETGGIGAMGDIGCYSLDMVLNAVGYPKPLTVTGYTSNFFGTSEKYSGYIKSDKQEYAKLFGVEDFAAAFVRLENDIILDFRISWAMHMDTPGDTLFLGTKGGLRVPSTNCWNGEFDKPMTIYHDIAGKPVETTIDLIPFKDNLFDMKIRSFLDAIKDNLPSPVPTSQIFYNQVIIDYIIKSANASKELTVELPDVF